MFHDSNVQVILLMCYITNMISEALTLSLMFIWNCHGETDDIARIVGGKDVKKADWKDWNFVVALYNFK